MKIILYIIHTANDSYSLICFQQNRENVRCELSKILHWEKNSMENVWWTGRFIKVKVLMSNMLI